MTLAPIDIPPDVLAQIYAHAREAFPAECCGYLTGAREAAGVDAMIACTNAQASGAHPTHPTRGADTGFVIAGAELFAFARAFDGEQPPRVLYHSHTNGRAYFSSIDQDLAAGPAYPVQHLVVGVLDGRVTEAAQFAWSGSAYVEVARWQGPASRAAQRDDESRGGG